MNILLMLSGVVIALLGYRCWLLEEMLVVWRDRAEFWREKAKYGGDQAHETHP